MYFSIPVFSALLALVVAAPTQEAASVHETGVIVHATQGPGDFISAAPTPATGLLESRQQSAYQIQFFSGTSCT